MARQKGSKNKPKEDKGTRPVTGQSIASSINSSMTKFAPLKIEGGQIPEAELVEMAERAKNYKNGTVVITDPILAAEMATSPLNASHKDYKPLPDNWNELGKVAKLEWLTAHPRR